MATIRQTSFAGGELSPLLWGRTDLEKFIIGLRRCRNFFISRQGAAVSRPGSKYLQQTKSVEVGIGGGGPIYGQLGARLIPFVFSDGQSYVLEVGQYYIRFFTAGGALLDANDAQVEVPTPFTADHIWKLQWAQSGDVLTFTHPDLGPYELKRLTPTNWRLDHVSFERPVIDSALTPYLAEPLWDPDAEHPGREWQWAVTEVRRDERGVAYETRPRIVAKYGYTFYEEWDEDIEYMTGAFVVHLGVQWRSLVDHNEGNLPPTSFGQWVMDGTTVSTTPAHLYDVPLKLVCYPDRPVTVRLRQVTGGLQQATSRFVAYRIYRGRGGLWGWMGDTDVDSFTDVGREPDYTISPPQGRNPFDAFGEDGAHLRTEEPLAVTYFQERRCFGGTTERPSFLFASATGDYSNFDERMGVPLAGESLAFDLVARRYSQIRSMVGLSRLIVLGSGCNWSVGGTEGDPLDFDSVDARLIEEVGANHMPPLVIDESVLYAREKGTGVRALVPAQGPAGYAGTDISAVSQHLFTGPYRGLLDWTYAEDPWGLVWATNELGQLLSLTYSQQEGIWAWAQHDSPEAFYESICAVPEGDEDAVYAVVRRRVRAGTFQGANYVYRRYVERFASRHHTGEPERDYVVLDSAATYSGPPTLTITGLSHLEGRSVHVVGRNVDSYGVETASYVAGPLPVSNATITLPSLPELEPCVLHIGLLFQPELETLDVAQSEARLRQKTVTQVGFEVDESRGIEAGQNLSTMVAHRTGGDTVNQVSSAVDLVKVPITSGYDGASRAALRVVQPRFVTVVGLTREVDLGG